MVKPLAFKGDKPNKKRKRAPKEELDHPAPTSTSQNDDDDLTWVSADTLPDISGPIMLVLPTTPPTSLSVDALGKIFPQPIENLVEDSSPQASAEPHDVRQVWVATRVVGSEKEFTFKGGSVGRYLGCDKFGVCEAGREAVSAEETFTLEEMDGGFAVKTWRGKYIYAEDGEVRGDGEEATRVWVRMQARFKPRHKVEKAEKVRSKISRKELEDEVGRRLEEDEVKKLKRARKEGDYHEVMLDVKVKGKHDKFA